MAAPARRLEVENTMDVDERLALLEDRTENIQRGLNEVSTKVDAARDAIGALAERTAVSIGALAAKTAEAIGAQEAKTEALVGALAVKTEAAIGALAAKTAEAIGELGMRMEAANGSLAEKIAASEARAIARQESLVRWIVGTAIGSAALVFAIAKLVL